MSLDTSKTNPKLGKRIAAGLKMNKIQTPMVISHPEIPNRIGMEIAFEQVLDDLGLDREDDSIIDTPRRLAKMYVDELCWGLKSENFPKCTTVENKMGYDAMIVERNISCISLCEHHFVTIDAKAHIAYIPGDKVLGLSKMNRIVEYFARRPQVQERMTEQIYYALSVVLGTKDVAVVIDGVHYCVKARGIEDHGSSTVTSKLGGSFRDDPQVRNEFLSLTREC